MMACFHELSSLWQCILLVISQFSVIFLLSGLILMFRRKGNLKKQVLMGVVFSINTLIYILMQLDSRITRDEYGLSLNVPSVLLMAPTFISFGIGIWLLIEELGSRKKIGQSSIKEAFDNLPAGVCFFNEDGLPVLCNLAMHRFSFAVCGKDVQFITDLEGCLDSGFSCSKDVRREGNEFMLADGRVWYLEKRCVIRDDDARYTQFIASDITDLHRSRMELQNENDQLRRVQRNLKKLSANVVAVTREEEILNAKMRVHDEMGRCLMAAQKYLSVENMETNLESIVYSWQRAVSSLKYNNESGEENALKQIRKTCESMKMELVLNGGLPEQGETAYILTCAVRECVTNAVRYANADKLYADFAETSETVSVTVTNSGKAPENEIREGGGLSTLRRRIESIGGTMDIQSLPYFKLTVTLPKRKEGIYL